MKVKKKKCKEMNKNKIDNEEKKRYQNNKVLNICECGITFSTHKSRHEKVKTFGFYGV
jgi:hypothetical protein